MKSEESMLNNNDNNKECKQDNEENMNSECVEEEEENEEENEDEDDDICFALNMTKEEINNLNHNELWEKGRECFKQEELLLTSIALFSRALEKLMNDEKDCDNNYYIARYNMTYGRALLDYTKQQPDIFGDAAKNAMNDIKENDHEHEHDDFVDHNEEQHEHEHEQHEEQQQDEDEDEEAEEEEEDDGQEEAEDEIAMIGDRTVDNDEQNNNNDNNDKKENDGQEENKGKVDLILDNALGSLFGGQDVAIMQSATGGNDREFAWEALETSRVYFEKVLSQIENKSIDINDLINKESVSLLLSDCHV
jgi:hypothetical protein